MSNSATNNHGGLIPQITLGWRLRMAMEHAGLKADDLAAEFGVHRGTITRWTHDIGSPPRRIYIQRWAELCGVSVEWLAGDQSFDRGPATRARRPASIRRVTLRSTHDWTTSTRRRSAGPAVTCRAAA